MDGEKLDGWQMYFEIREIDQFLVQLNEEKADE